jgi:hypothetical protein
VKSSKRKTVAGLRKWLTCLEFSLTETPPEEAKAKVQALALRVVADRLEHGEAGPDLVSISFATA